MIGLRSDQGWVKTKAYLAKLQERRQFDNLHSYGRAGVRALASATPVDTGETAASWDYEIVKTKTGLTIFWTNRHVVNDVPIAVILQYGHGTGTGGYVQGRDYINPSIRPIFDKIAEKVWREVTNG